MPSADDEFLTVVDIARILKLNQQTVRNWIDQGRLPAIRIGRRVRVRRTDYKRMIEHGLDSEPQPEREPSIWDGHIPKPVLRTNQQP